MTGVKEAGGRPAVHQANPQTAVQFSKGPHPHLQASIHSASILLLLPPAPNPPSLPLSKPTVSITGLQLSPSLIGRQQLDRGTQLVHSLHVSPSNCVGSTVVTPMTTINNVTEARDNTTFRPSQLLLHSFRSFRSTCGRARMSQNRAATAV